MSFNGNSVNYAHAWKVGKVSIICIMSNLVFIFLYLTKVSLEELILQHSNQKLLCPEFKKQTNNSYHALNTYSINTALQNLATARKKKHANTFFIKGLTPMFNQKAKKKEATTTRRDANISILYYPTATDNVWFMLYSSKGIVGRSSFLFFRWLCYCCSCSCNRGAVSEYYTGFFSLILENLILYLKM